MGMEFTQGSHSPRPLAHNRFDQRGDFSQHQQRFGFPGPVSLMLVFRNQGINLAHFGSKLVLPASVLLSLLERHHWGWHQPKGVFPASCPPISRQTKKAYRQLKR